ncbi:MAG TPA: hypothetical protein VGQ76_26750 [Thermoanaerobaculia bacterium]|jgi:hypothetical protein|nr:hypothetical protein [Thermoanaerobaculia bacterium]
MKRLLPILLAAPLLFAQVSPKPADAIVPVVGSTRGQSNTSFKTELQLTNTADITSSGWLIYRPAGLVRRYELAAFATLSFADVVAEMGGTGLGSLDVLVDAGTLPTIVARAYDDQPAGTTGVTVPAIRLESVLIRNETAALIAPRDLTRYRFNIGVRALEAGATLDLIVHSASGATRNARSLTFAEHEFRQQPGNDFAGIALQSDDSIEIRIAAGSAIVYATTVDNVTNDGAIQVLRR